MSGEWENGLCEHICGGDCGTCMGAWFCPCFLYGRVSSRYKALPKNKDNIVNGSCFLWSLASCVGLWWVPQMLRRQEMRQRFDIEGNGCTDCLVTTFCGACSLAQMNMEVKERAAKARQYDMVAPAYSSEDQRMVYEEHMPMNGTQYENGKA